MAGLTARPAAGLVADMASGRVGASELMASTLARIEAVNPTLNAIVSLRDPDELMAAARAAEAAPGQGALHGLPVAVKDLVATDGLRTTWGSPLYTDHVPAQDDLLAARLKTAGAIVIGKTNVPEFGLGSHSYNPVYGVTRNPYDPTRAAGGSSGGAAAALASGMLTLADGSDMMGSLRNPAGWCNVYSLRPSWGVVPAEPQGEMFLHQLSTDGPLARCPQDLELLLEVLAGPDPRAPHTRPLGAEPLAAEVAGRRIGWLGDWGGDYPMEPGILETCRAALDVFARLGCNVTEAAPPFDAAQLWKSWTTLRSFAVMGRLRTIYGDAEKRARLKPEAEWEVERGLALTAVDIQAASETRSDWYRRCAQLFTRYDALVLPTAQCWPFPAEWHWPKEIAGVTMDTYHRWMEVVVPVALAGLPCVTLPAGFGPKGLPMGLQLFGPRGSDRRLLQLAEGYHRATDWPHSRPPPAPPN